MDTLRSRSDRLTSRSIENIEMLKNFIFESLEKILDILCNVDTLRSRSDRLTSRSIENIEMLKNFIFESLNVGKNSRYFLQRGYSSLSPRAMQNLSIDHEKGSKRSPSRFFFFFFFLVRRNHI